MLSYDNLDLGPVTISCTFNKDQPLPKVGEVVKDNLCTMVIIAVDPESGSVKALLTPTETVSSRMKRYTESMLVAPEHVASLIYHSTSTGMMSLIGWENLPDTSKEDYMLVAQDIIKYLSEAGVLVLPYG